MSVWLLVVTALLYLIAGVSAIYEGNNSIGYVLLSFFVSNLALAHASVS